MSGNPFSHVRGASAGAAPGVAGARRLRVAAMSGMLVAGLLAAEGEAQTQLRNRSFLNLGEPESYLNYGRKEYEPYPNVLSARNQYDRLGNFLMRGHEMVTIDNVRPGRSSVDRSNRFLQWFNDLIIAQDSYGSWNYTMTIGDDIRTKLSSLTMMHPRWNGVRFDGASSDNQFTLLFTQGGSTIASSQSTLFSTFGTSSEEISTVQALAGHWQTKLGGVLNLGATFYNQHMSDSFNARNGSLLKGDTPYAMLPPSIVLVAIEDDSPEEAANDPIVYGVEITVIGERAGERVTLTSLDSEVQALPPVGGVATGGGRRASGADRVVYEFRLPQVIPPSPEEYAADPTSPLGGITVKEVRFRVDVEGDYRIGMRQRHLYFDEKAHGDNLSNNRKLGDTRYKDPYSGLAGNDAVAFGNNPLDPALIDKAYRTWPVKADPTIVGSSTFPYRIYKWDQAGNDTYYTVARADGTGGGRRTVTVDYGVPTAQSLYGLNWDLHSGGLKINGEFIANPQSFIYPVGRNAGQRTSKQPWAYFVNAEQKLATSYRVGAEVFRLDPDYSGDFDSRRGGMAFFTDRAPVTYAIPRMEEYSLMEDNDDLDQWIDESPEELPSAENVDSGVFPGLDENGDLVPDTDQNGNGTPDWTEPVLFYDQDPPEFVYGEDFNNNGVVDYRENDNLPDYPYRRDREGLHAFASRDGLGPFGRYLSLGYYDMSEIAGGGEASAVYARYAFRTVTPFFGRVSVQDDIKLVKDTIRDDVYVWQNIASALIANPNPLFLGKIDQRDYANSQLFQPPADPLVMRNSTVNTLFVEAHFNQITDLNVINNVQWIRNSQKADDFDDGSAQEDDLQHRVTVANKVDYTVRAGDVRVKPMFKHLYLKDDIFLNLNAGVGRERKEQIWTPILRVDWDLTPKSSLQAGYQGLPFWRYRFRDHIDESQDFKQWEFVLMFSNRSDYWGYNIAHQFGFIKRDREHDDDGMKALDQRTSTLFFDLVIGY